MSINWVMLSQKGEIVKLPRETMLHKPQSRLSLEVKGLPSQSSFSISNAAGEVYLTSQRVIYLPAKPTDEFKSFATQILDVEDARIESPWFGSWYWHGIVKPVSQGGIPPDVARVDVKITFKDGGHNDFHEKFVQIKERLFHARELERELGHRVTIPDEQLPAYQASEEAGQASGTGLAPPQPVRSDSSASRSRAPDEPPPDYDEAQAQEVSMRLEDHIRDEADHR